MIGTFQLGQTGLASRAAATGPADPSFASRVLVLPFDGANAGVSITDYSSYAHAFTAFGNAQLSTSRPKYGSAAGEFDGSGDYFQCAGAPEFLHAANNFTIEGWFETDTVTGLHAICGYANGNTTNANYQYQLLLNGSSLNFSAFNGTTQFNATKSGVVIGTKHFFRFVRNGTNLYAELDGVAGTPVAVSTTAFNPITGATFQIGQVQGAFPWDGMIDDLRISAGIVESGAVPTAAFPTH